MTISQGSRYFLAQQRKVSTAQGDQMVVYTSPVKFSGANYVEILTIVGQTMDSIAARVYGDAAQWWRIADANPQVSYPMDMPPGTILRIPQ